MKKKPVWCAKLLLPAIVFIGFIGWVLYYAGDKKKKIKVNSGTNLNRELLKYKIERIIDTVLPVFFMVFALLWFGQSIFTIVMSQSVFVPITLWPTPITMHVSTALSCCLIYMIGFHFYRTFQFGHERVVRALMFTVLGVVFYDTVWAALNYAFNGSGSFILPGVSTLIIVFYLFILHRQKRILVFKLNRIALISCVYLLSLILLLHSGFFEQWGLYEQGLAVDPTGWEWLVNKTVALWMWMAVALR